MKSVLKLEELGMFLLGIYALIWYEVPYWVYFLVLLGPDISMLGYLGGNRLGAISYNLFHHKGVASLVFASGLLAGNVPVQVIGIILFTHSSMDRLLGYGLKYFDGFGYTHLGKIGKSKQ